MRTMTHRDRRRFLELLAASPLASLLDLPSLIAAQSGAAPATSDLIASVGDAINVFDFDVTEINYGEFLQPSATLLKSFYGSDQVDKEGSYNYGGVADPALDAAMAAMDAATTREELRDAARAFDRVFMQQHYVVPWSRRPAFNSAWWDRLGIPARRPRYFTLINDTNNAQPWPIQTWWAAPAGGGKR